MMFPYVLGEIAVLVLAKAEYGRHSLAVHEPFSMAFFNF
jgi:hypothetical protein